MTRSHYQVLLVFIVGLAALISHSIAHASGPLGTCTLYHSEGSTVHVGWTELFCSTEAYPGFGWHWQPASSGSTDRHLLVCDGTWIFEGAIECDGTLESVDSSNTELWLYGGWDADGFAAGFSMVIMLFVTGLGIGLIISVIRKTKGV